MSTTDPTTNPPVPAADAKQPCSRCGNPMTAALQFPGFCEIRATERANS